MTAMNGIVADAQRAVDICCHSKLVFISSPFSFLTQNCTGIVHLSSTFLQIPDISQNFPDISSIFGMQWLAVTVLILCLLTD